MSCNARDVNKLHRLTSAAIMLSFLLALAIAYLHRNDSLAGLIDEAEYNRLALAILSHQEYDSTYWLPGFPAFVAVVYAIFGQSLLAVYAAHAVLWVACLVAVYFIALRTLKDPATAATAVLLCVLWWPFYTNLIPRMMTEMLASLLVAGALLACITARDARSLVASLVTGVLIGAGALTKSVVFAFLPLAAVYVGWGMRRDARLAAVLIIGCAVVVGPWMWRNYRVTGEFVPVSTGAGYNFWFGNHPEVYRRRVNDARELISEVQGSLRGRTEVGRDRVFARMALERMREQPLQAASIMLQKFSKLWLGKLGLSPKTAPGPILSIGDFGVPPGSVVRTVLFCIAVLGWFTLSADAKSRCLPLAVILIVWTLSYVLLTAEPRYAYPVQFYEIILAAVFLRRVAEQTSMRKVLCFAKSTEAES